MALSPGKVMTALCSGADDGSAAACRYAFSNRVTVASGARVAPIVKRAAPIFTTSSVSSRVAVRENRSIETVSPLARTSTNAPFSCARAAAAPTRYSASPRPIQRRMSIASPRR